MGVAVAGKIGAKYLALFNQTGQTDAPDNGVFNFYRDNTVMEETRSRPKSSYAGSYVGSRIKSRASTEVRSR